MSSLFAAMSSAGTSLAALERAIAVVQNNVANATTPGYVTQTLQMSAGSFNPAENLWGGVQVAGVQSARDVYAEKSVWTASQQSGFSTQQSTSLDALEKLFDVSGKTGVPSALSSLYSAFSAWSSSPSDASARQQVITAAKNLAAAFNQTESQAQQVRTDSETQISASADQINQYATQIAAINKQIRAESNPTGDAGLQAQLYTSIENLSGLAPVSVHMETDGTATVLLGGQSPLVMGETHNDISVKYTQSATAAYPGGAPAAQILSSDGHDITSLVSSGTLGGALDFRNNIISAVLGDGQQQGSLNELAQGVADRVNDLLTSGQVSAGPPAVAGVPLFSYDTTSPTGVANSFSVASSIDATQLAAIDPGPPVVANGIASKLSSLANPKDSADMINGFSFTQYYGNIATDLGQQASAADASAQSQTQILNQAQTVRSQVSGVDLNAQATKLLEFQQAYQASAQLITVLNTLTQSLLNIFQ